MLEGVADLTAGMFERGDPGLGRAGLQIASPIPSWTKAPPSNDFSKGPLGDAALSRQRCAQDRLHQDRANAPQRKERRAPSPSTAARFEVAEPISPSRSPRRPLCGLGPDPGPSGRRTSGARCCAGCSQQDKARNAKRLAPIARIRPRLMPGIGVRGSHRPPATGHGATARRSN